MARRRGWRRYRLTRDALLMGVGLLGVGYEAVVHRGEPRAGLLFMYASMMGLPIMFKRDGA